MLELLNALDVPLLDENVTFTNGMNGYPAFSFKSSASIHKPASEFIRRLSSDFSLLINVKPSNTPRNLTDLSGETSENGGFLFAVVNPANTLVQFGIEISKVSSSLEKNSLISLYYTDYRTAKNSQIIAKFVVQDLFDSWTSFALMIRKDVISLYLNCELYNSQTFSGRSLQLEFEAGSKLWIASAGPKIGRKFLVRFYC